MWGLSRWVRGVREAQRPLRIPPPLDPLLQLCEKNAWARLKIFIPTEVEVVEIENGVPARLSSNSSGNDRPNDHLAAGILS